MTPSEAPAASAESSPVGSVSSLQQSSASYQGAPRMPDESQQGLADTLWAAMQAEMERRMVAMETEMIKRHNVKMLNEMQEVVRQIKSAKAKNDEVLRDYHKKFTELSRSVVEMADKVTLLRAEADESKRSMAAAKQQVSQRCDQCVEQLNQLKQAVFTAWQKEKGEMQNKVSSAFRSDLTLVLQQCDNKLRENFAETAKLKTELKRVLAKLNGEDPESVEPVVAQSAGLSIEGLSSLGSNFTPPVQESVPAAPPAMDESVLQQQLKNAAAGQPLNMAVLQQFMTLLPKSQQQQLQTIIQQKAAQARAAAPAVSAPPVAASAPAPPSAPVTAAAAAPPGLTSTSSPTKVLCPFFSTFAVCRFGDKCRYVHSATGKEPLRDLPLSVIQTLQAQLTSGGAGGQINASSLAAVLARSSSGGPAAVLQQLQQASQVAARAAVASAGAPPGLTAAAVPPGLGSRPISAEKDSSTTSTAAVNHAMIQAQIQAQNEAQSMGLAKAKLLPCRFQSIGRCAYGEKCAYSHEAAGVGAGSAAAVSGKSASSSNDSFLTQFMSLQQQNPPVDDTGLWGKTGLFGNAWAPKSGLGGVSAAPFVPAQEEQLIVDGDDDQQYDRWNDATFGEEEPLPPPPGLTKSK